MKNLFFILAFLLSIVSVKANHNSSELLLELAKPGNYTIIIDGVVYPNVNKSLFIPSIEAGLHHIETIKHVTYGKHGYKYGSHHVKKVVICDRYIKIHPNTHVDAVINAYNDLIIANKYTLYQMPAPVLNTPVCLNSKHECGYGNCHQPTMHMSHGEFQNLVNIIGSKAYASDKKSIAMMAISTNFLLADQVAKLVSLMPYESDKVEVAKTAYGKTINKEDYYIVNKEFYYSSSINDLEYFIYAHK